MSTDAQEQLTSPDILFSWLLEYWKCLQSLELSCLLIWNCTLTIIFITFSADLVNLINKLFLTCFHSVIHYSLLFRQTSFFSVPLIQVKKNTCIFSLDYSLFLLELHGLIPKFLWGFCPGCPPSNYFNKVR